LGDTIGFQLLEHGLHVMMGSRTINNEKAYNISSNMGLQLVLKIGEKILIGTQKTEELLVVLEKN
jgi:hypothetical protein